MTRKEEFKREAKGYAWSHQTLGVDKITFESEDDKLIDVYNMVRVPIYNNMYYAAYFGMAYANRTMLEKLKEFVDHHTDIKDVYEFIAQNVVK